MTLIGFLLCCIHTFFNTLDIDPAIIVPIYLFSLMPIGFAVLGNSLGSGTIMQVVDLVTVSGVVFLCTTFAEHRVPVHRQTIDGSAPIPLQANIPST